MPSLRVRCPRCDQITRTGISIRGQFNLENFQRKSMNCQHCGRRVTWNGEDVVNREDFA